ncbi:P2X purinoceptor 4-like isoform X5 [Caretta caretta]|uniref:P2X purinoceptor 4-like isoform X5 n=1 Tax=Caretta caretta TaxID=8467 RepID=UPI0020940320|nr:P2X purinoceptor 4-like isoform X5 [Caretta caretta]
MASGACCGVLRGFLFEYDTPRIVLIKSRKVGLVNRAVQLAILAYVIGWVFVWEKGYQETDSVVSSVTAKVKGITMTNTSELGLRVWDVADYVIPPQLPDKTTVCNSSEDCSAGYIGTHSNGVQTGKCRKYSTSVKTCEIYAWCPVENDTHLPKPAFLKDAENFTILVKNNIWYPKFNFTRRNILPSISTTYLKTCIYHPKTDPFCPIFRVRQIVEAAGQNFQEMAVEGGVMGVQINWNCDLDKPAYYCVPKYTFRRLDNKDANHRVSPGYNFRFAKYYKDASGTDSRTLIKAYGIRFDIMVFGKVALCFLNLMVFGKAGKFDIIPTMINIGSGLALFGVATVLCDIVVLYFMKKRYYYREKKYKYVEDYELGADFLWEDSFFG